MFFWGVGIYFSTGYNNRVWVLNLQNMAMFILIICFISDRFDRATPFVGNKTNTFDDFVLSRMSLAH